VTVTVELAEDALPLFTPRGVRRVTRRRLKKWRSRERAAGRKVRKLLRGAHSRWTLAAVMGESLIEGALREHLFGPSLFGPEVP
jgi:hypothetical protein